MATRNSSLCVALSFSVLLPVAGLQAATLGDFNGDGFADLMVGAPRDDPGGLVDGGSVTVIYGSVAGLDAATSQYLKEADVGLAAAGNLFGTAVAALDFNDDGFDDLAVGVPDMDVNEGNDGGVYVLFGSSLGVVTTSPLLFDQGTGVFNESPEKNDRFGTVMTAGDFDGDGVEDLAIGVGEENFKDDGQTDGNTGEVNVLYGSRTGNHQAQIISRECWSVGLRAEDWFGNTVVAADFNGDLLADLAVGTPGHDPAEGKEAGEVRVGYGQSPVICADFNSGDRFRQSSPGLLDESEARDFFGDAVAGGDFDGDGFDDLAVGVSGESFFGVVKGGAVSILRGSAGGLTTNQDQLWTLDSPGVVGEAARGDLFGNRLVTGDFNGDGYADLAIDVPGHDAGLLDNAGAVSVLYGSPTGLEGSGSQFWLQGVDGVPGEAGAKEYFGAALASGDVDGDGFDELLLGTPREVVSGFASAGAVTVLPGSAAGLTSSGATLWSQDTALVPGDAAAGNRFGAGLPGSTGKRWQAQLNPPSGP